MNGLDLTISDIYQTDDCSFFILNNDEIQMVRSTCPKNANAAGGSRKPIIIQYCEDRYPIVKIEFTDDLESELEGGVWYGSECLLTFNMGWRDNVLDILTSKIPEIFSLKGDDFKAWIAASKVAIIDAIQKADSKLVIFDFMDRFDNFKNGLDSYFINADDLFFDGIMDYCISENIPFLSIMRYASQEEALSIRLSLRDENGFSREPGLYKDLEYFEMFEDVEHLVDQYKKSQR